MYVYIYIASAFLLSFLIVLGVVVYLSVGVLLRHVDGLGHYCFTSRDFVVGSSTTLIIQLVGHLCSHASRNGVIEKVGNNMEQVGKGSQVFIEHSHQVANAGEAIKPIIHPN